MKSPALIFGLLFLSSSVVFAALGDNGNSIKSEVEKLRAKRTVTQHTAYATHEITRKGLLLHQFVGGDGNVFAMAWNGRNHPDMNLIMGAHLSEFKEALAKGQKGHHGRGSFSADVGDFHLEMGGHMMAVHGRVWLTSRIPGGVKSDELR